MDLDENGVATMLGSSAWQKYRQRLRDLGGPPLQ